MSVRNVFGGLGAAGNAAVPDPAGPMGGPAVPGAPAGPVQAGNAPVSGWWAVQNLSGFMSFSCCCPGNGTVDAAPYFFFFWFFLFFFFLVFFVFFFFTLVCARVGVFVRDAMVTRPITQTYHMAAHRDRLFRGHDCAVDVFSDVRGGFAVHHVCAGLPPASGDTSTEQPDEMLLDRMSDRENPQPRITATSSSYCFSPPLSVLFGQVRDMVSDVLPIQPLMESLEVIPSRISEYRKEDGFWAFFRGGTPWIG